MPKMEASFREISKLMGLKMTWIDLRVVTYLKMTAINCYRFDIKGVPEPQIAKIVKSVKVWSPPSQLTGDKMEEQLRLLFF